MVTAARLALARGGGHLTSCQALEPVRLSSDHWGGHLAPARGEVCPLALPPSRAPHSGLCPDAFEVLILPENRHVFQNDLVRSARQACSMESVPHSQS